MDERNAYPFEFSVIMAVYNVEPFLREAVESLIAQDFGFERIQLIMVDDGSTDRSGAICDEYAQAYPHNILALHKENGGVSSARNLGLQYATGRYLNFLDSDDKLTDNAMRVVAECFEEFGEVTDVVSIPIFFFDRQKGEHWLNYKFRKGKRCINLLENKDCIQMHISSSFIRSTATENMHFSEQLAYAEDCCEILKVLINRPMLGVAPDAKYMYRKRTVGAASALDVSYNSSKYYSPCIRSFSLFICHYALEKCGYIPYFVQYSVMADLQWKIRLTRIEESTLFPSSLQQYMSEMHDVLVMIDDQIIMSQKYLYNPQKVLALEIKYGRKTTVDFDYRPDNICLRFDNLTLSMLGTNLVKIDFFEYTGNQLRIEGLSKLILSRDYSVKTYVSVNGVLHLCQGVQRELDEYAMNRMTCRADGFRAVIQVSPDEPLKEIRIVSEINGKRIPRTNLVYGKFFPVAQKNSRAYAVQNGFALTVSKQQITLKKCGWAAHIGLELRYLYSLWKSNKKGERKAIAVRILYHLLRHLPHKKILLISDRLNKADDNGETLFRYMRQLASSDYWIFFVLHRESEDYERLRQVGSVIIPFSRKHKLLHLLSSCVISSQGEDYIVQPFRKHGFLYQDLNYNKKFVFLQHGVTKDDLSQWLNKYNKHLDLFITATHPEYASILDGKYFYTQSEVKLTGFPRYDLLYHDEKKRITIMPTWRAYLVQKMSPKTGLRELKPNFINSQYYRNYSQLINCTKLFDVAEQLGYEIHFLHHPNMLQSVALFHGDKRLCVDSINTSYRSVFAESNLIVTDYSSVAFDFAYLRKPVVYFQEDQEEFFSGVHTYQKGYFNYETDGFGEVTYNVEELVNCICAYMANGCQLKEQYREIIDRTFPFNDKNNCERVFEQIKLLTAAKE